MKIKYTPKMLQFLKDNKVNTNKDLIEMFYKKFGVLLTSRRLQNIRQMYKLQSGLKGGQFEKGHTPKNKGKKWSEYLTPEQQAKIRATIYQKGHIPHNHLEVGAERIIRDDYIEVKTTGSVARKGLTADFQQDALIMRFGHKKHLLLSPNIVGPFLTPILI